MSRSRGDVTSYTIGEAATAAGVTPRAIRLYESKGLVAAPVRTESGYRLFTDDDIEVFAFIRQGRSLGLSLDAIAEIVEASKLGAPCDRTAVLLAQRLSEIDAAIADLRRLRTTIRHAQRANVDQSSGARCAVIEQVGNSN